MPRLPRVHIPNALYLVTSCSAEPLVLFHDAEDYGAYKGLLAQYTAECSMRLYAYCLLEGQVHMLLEPMSDSGTVSSFMHVITSRYTKYYNRRYGRSGHLFQARFKSSVIEKNPAELLEYSAYLHRLPEQTGARADYPHSSFPEYRGFSAASKGLITAEAAQCVLQTLDAKATIGEYCAYVDSFSDAAMQRAGKQLDKRVIGSDAFIERVRGGSAAQSVSSAPETAEGRASAPRGWGRMAARTTVWIAAGAVAMLSLRGGTAPDQPNTRPLMAAAAEKIKSAGEVSLVGTNRLFSLGFEGLEGSAWQVHLVPKDGAAGVPEKDVLVFTGKKVSSRLMSARGVEGSNYTITPQANGAMVWETMQTGQRGEIVCWRGEWSQNRMQGVVTRQEPGKPLSTYEFVGVFESYVHLDRTEI